MKRILTFTTLCACFGMLVQGCKKNEPRVKDINPVMVNQTTRTKVLEHITGPAAAGTYQFVSYVTYSATPRVDKSISVVGGSTTSGALLDQQVLAGAVQEWRITNLGNGDYCIINLNSGKALTVPGGALTEDERLTQSLFDINNNGQRWKISYQGLGVYRIKTKLDTTKGVHVAGGSTASGAGMVLETFSGGTNQGWGYFLLNPLAISNTPVIIHTPDGNHTDTYPRVIQLSDGSLLASFTMDTASTMPNVFGHGVVKFYKSTNGGSSWSLLSTLSDTHRGQGCYDANVFVMPSTIGTVTAGTLIAQIRSAFWVSTSYIDLYKSTNNGASWSYMSSVAAGNGFTHNIYEPFLMVDGFGRLICYYSDERDAAHSQKLVYQISPDGGLSWGATLYDVVALPTQNDRPGMFRSSKMNNGTWIMTYEYVNYPSGGTFYSPVFFKTSTDGVNWNGGASNAGTLIASGSDLMIPEGTPSVVYASGGSTRGTIVVSSIADYPVNPSGSDNMVNFDYSGLYWYRVPQPLPYNGANANAGYSRCVGVSADGNTLYHINCVDFTTRRAQTEFVATPAW